MLRISTAYQAAYKELNARGQKLNEDAQKEQTALRDLGQSFAAERAKLSPEQIRTKEKEIQERATEAQRSFGERNRIIQEAGQYVMMQINRTMEQVAQQVALSRGINLVLNRAQILGTTADFDLTPAVADVLNKALPSVVVPPDGYRRWRWRRPAAAAAGAAPAPRRGTDVPAHRRQPQRPRRPSRLRSTRPWRPAQTPLDDDRSAAAGDPRFFRRAGPHTLAAVVDAAAVEGTAPRHRRVV